MGIDQANGTLLATPLGIADPWTRALEIFLTWLLALPSLTTDPRTDAIDISFASAGLTAAPGVLITHLIPGARRLGTGVHTVPFKADTTLVTVGVLATHCRLRARSDLKVAYPSGSTMPIVETRRTVDALAKRLSAARPFRAII